jgi:hypothetical protein
MPKILANCAGGLAGACVGYGIKVPAMMLAASAVVNHILTIDAAVIVAVSVVVAAFVATYATTYYLITKNRNGKRRPSPC